MIYSHLCVCGKSYSDDDPDLYKCPSCIEEHKVLAKDIEKRFENRPKKKQMSDLQAYDAAPKAHGFMIVKL